jgi:hypothetical protein
VTPANTTHGRQAVAPSAVKPNATMFTPSGLRDIPERRTLQADEIPAGIQAFHGAKMGSRGDESAVVTVLEHRIDTEPARDERVEGRRVRPLPPARCPAILLTPHRMFLEPVRYAAAGGPNHVVSASASPSWVRSPTQATYPSGLVNTAMGAVTVPIAGSSQVPTYLASTD